MTRYVVECPRCKTILTWTPTKGRVIVRCPRMRNDGQPPATGLQEYGTTDGKLLYTLPFILGKLTPTAFGYYFDYSKPDVRCGEVFAVRFDGKPRTHGSGSGARKKPRYPVAGGVRQLG